jgi:hypothetical protein
VAVVTMKAQNDEGIEIFTRNPQQRGRLVAQETHPRMQFRRMRNSRTFQHHLLEWDDWSATTRGTDDGEC